MNNIAITANDKGEETFMSNILYGLKEAVGMVGPVTELIKALLAVLW